MKIGSELAIVSAKNSRSVKQPCQVLRPTKSCDFILSTLQTFEGARRKGRVRRFFHFFFGKLRLLISCLLCGCFSPNRINWSATKKKFDDVVSAVFPNGTSESSKDRRARFANAVDGLSDTAIARFEKHLGMVYAGNENSSLDEKGKEEWYKNNKKKINVDQFANDLGNKVLKEAVKNFQKEIANHV